MWPFRRTPKSISTKSMPVTLRARYDAAQTTRENMRYWAMADSLSADEANSLEVRSKLRQRARYEVANNSYAKGIILTLANDCVGTGPRLQVLTNDSDFNRKVESAFMAWAKRIGLAAKLRTMRMAKATDGESFGLLIRNDAISGPVKLDLALVEADRVTDPSPQSSVFSKGKLKSDSWGLKTGIDGLDVDSDGNVVRYYLLRQHPGDLRFGCNDYSVITADSMVHWYRADRPGQHRGVPEITASLPLFAQLRRYTLAVLGAAETAADFAAVLFTDAPANGEAASVEPMDIIELEKRMATVLPDGWKLAQIKAEQPATSYAEFKREILNEIARCLNLPYNIAACNSSGYNYASGRLDHQVFRKAIRVEQADMESVILDKIFPAWCREYSLQSSDISPQLLNPEDWGLKTESWPLPHQWFFDGSEHVDPAKEANAQDTRLGNHSTNLSIEYAKQGRDWETELQQRSKEIKLMQQLGLKQEETQPVTTVEDDDEED